MSKTTKYYPLILFKLLNLIYVTKCKNVNNIAYLPSQNVSNQTTSWCSVLVLFKY